MGSIKCCSLLAKCPVSIHCCWERSPSIIFISSICVACLSECIQCGSIGWFGESNQGSITIDMTLIGVSYPLSAGAFRGDVRSYLDPIIGHLAWARTPLLANIYTYFSYSGNPRDISLPYALFTSPSPIVWDQGRGYQNLFDAMLDSLYSALEKAGQGGLEVVVSESGWPSAGGFGTSVDNAATYLSNLIKHVQKGTPKRPGKAIETYLFALFDENQKSGPELERHFGLFSPNKQPKYQLHFGGGRHWDIASKEYNATFPLKSDM
ncbi:hypothetical protein ES288_D09G088100v1 [Gossypium darwinii]|uniref:glucan endo-1,3-beta-D-glucosidase n=1 Tax=Gossypium darwinii TaxID=34276 RepID=A0A5D2B772_GOSDA|nr:hypothetical protein ES288_D09G088100v1 [Gossypium darwinii]